MKRKFVTGLIILAVSILLTIGVLALLPTQFMGKELLSASVDADKELELHLEGYHVKLMEWNGSEIKINESKLRRDLCDDNTIFTLKDNILTNQMKGISLSKVRERDSLNVFQTLIWPSLLHFEKYFDYANEVWDYMYVDYYVYVPDGIKVKVHASGIIGSNEVDYESELD